VSQDENEDGFEYSPIEPQPEAGSRRISAPVAASVVLGCAAFGTVMGVLLPLHPRVDEHMPQEPADLRLASAKLVDANEASALARSSMGSPSQTAHPEAAVAGRATPVPRAVASAPTAVSTSSVDRLPTSDAGESARLTASDREVVARSEPASLGNRSHHAARAKRLRRILWRRTRVKPVGANIDSFFSSLFSFKM
jgi:hypothetical protein